MPWSVVLVRWLCLLSWGVWVGGFMFYGGVVVPILHEAFDGLQAGGVTARVTDRLNVLGVVAIGLAWLEASVVGPEPQIVARVRRLALGLSTGMLAALIVLHRIMDERLAASPLADFYPLHRVYLGISTAQWISNLIVLLTWILRWGTPRR